MSDWKEKLNQVKDQLKQQPERKPEHPKKEPTTKLPNQPSCAKTEPPLSEEDLFIKEMEREGVKPIPEFISLMPEQGAVKRVVLKPIDVATVSTAQRSRKRHMVRIQPKHKMASVAILQKTVSSKLPHEIPSGKNRVTIGIDFGTSTTKICARQELGSDDIPIYRIDIADRSDGLNPSLISIDDSALFFGDHAQRGILIPHVKVCLACAEKRFGTQECLWAETCPVSASSLTASDLATLYLAWVMKESRKRLSEPFKKADGFIFNVGVPLKHLDDTPLKNIFEQITYFAWRLSEGISQGLSVEQAKAWLDIVKQQHGNVPPPDERMIQLCPETSASIVSFVKSTNARKGLYCLCDIGAWTSDISVFRLTDIDKHETGVDRLSFYASGVTRKACEEIDTRVVHSLAELWGLNTIEEFLDPEILSEIRYVREHGEQTKKFSVSSENNMQRERKIPKIALDYARQVVAEAVSRDFIKILRQAYEKESVPDRWRNISLIMTGGGSQDSIFEKVFTGYCGCQFHKVSLKMDTIKNASKEQHFRFAVATGLSHPLATWPEQLLPSEIASWQPKAVKHIDDRDEQYPK